MRQVQMVSTAPRPGVVLVRVRGELDWDAGAVLAAILRHALADPALRLLVLDCARLNFMDVTCLNKILRARRQARERGADFRLVRPTPAVRRLLALCAVEELLAVSAELPTAATVLGTSAAGTTRENGRAHRRRPLLPGPRLPTGRSRHG